MSTRQAERLRRRSAAATTNTATAAKRHPAASASPHARGGRAPSPTRDYSRPTSKSFARGSGAAKNAPSAGVGVPGNTAATLSAGASRPPMRGRFNRLVMERGFFFTVYLYVLGESMTLCLAYLLHTRSLSIGDAGSWLAALHSPADRYLNAGPTVYGLQLTPRLLLNYLAANACTYPLLPLQIRFCTATAPALYAPFSWISRRMKKPKPVIPKAPSAKP
ncbi:hypothetical protein ABL78_0256 [Leptomonas seymouri]|uniref:Uncharacterized protein n=1 Tax=Leptomonas seymouri TaxID=5684 RepID=A0A0N1IAL2_LEPSE|nr:hypothetical protein ABL78_0256 [Leptomonas seymouri]|eukprot:KPI90660.1 hypothetical protein ABL78_0256 [Leptomonas seymouri]